MSRTLYKYTSAKYLDSILKHGGRLKLSFPSTFNDPKDSNFGIADENLKKSYRMLKNVAFICEYKNDPIYQKSKTYKSLFRLTEENTKKTRIYYENPGVNLMINGYLKSRKNLKDFFDKNEELCRSTFVEIIEKLRSQSLIGSLTTENNNILMWSHYGDKHEGICVEYEFNEDKDLLDVSYTDDINNFDLYTVLQYIIPAKYFGVSETKEMDSRCVNACYLPFLKKLKCWSYEKEVRMIFNLNNTSKLEQENGIWFYPSVKVKSIYLGCKMNNSVAKTILEKCSALKIPVYRFVQEQEKNELTLIQ